MGRLFESCFAQLKPIIQNGKGKGGRYLPDGFLRWVLLGGSNYPKYYGESRVGKSKFPSEY